MHYRMFSRPTVFYPLYASSTLQFKKQKCLQTSFNIVSWNTPFSILRTIVLSVWNIFTHYCCLMICYNTVQMLCLLTLSMEDYIDTLFLLDTPLQIPSAPIIMRLYSTWYNIWGGCHYFFLLCERLCRGINTFCYPRFKEYWFEIMIYDLNQNYVDIDLSCQT